jgi:hypothetical protein
MSDSILKKKIEILSNAVENKIESVLSSAKFDAMEFEVEELGKKNYNAQVNVDNILPKYMSLKKSLKWMYESHDYQEGYSEAVSDYINMKLEFAETESLYISLLQEHAVTLKAYADKCLELQRMNLLRSMLNTIREAEHSLIKLTPDVMSITEYDDILEKRRQEIRNMWNDLGHTRDYEVDDIRSFYEQVVQALADRYGISFAEMIERERKERAEFDAYGGIIV